jgi:hypothetical protein
MQPYTRDAALSGVIARKRSETVVRQVGGVLKAWEGRIGAAMQPPAAKSLSAPAQASVLETSVQELRDALVAALKGCGYPDSNSQRCAEDLQAGLIAYLKIATKRFVDGACMIVRTYLVDAVAEGARKALRAAQVGLDESLEETPEVKRRRGVLKSDIDKFRAALDAFRRFEMRTLSA